MSLHGCVVESMAAKADGGQHIQEPKNIYSKKKLFSQLHWLGVSGQNWHFFMYGIHQMPSYLDVVLLENSNWCLEIKIRLTGMSELETGLHY